MPGNKGQPNSRKAVSASSSSSSGGTKGGSGTKAGSASSSSSSGGKKGGSLKDKYIPLQWDRIKEKASSYKTGDQQNVTLNRLALGFVSKWESNLRNMCSDYQNTTRREREQQNKALGEVAPPLLFLIRNLPSKSKGIATNGKREKQCSSLKWNDIEKRIECFNQPLDTTISLSRQIFKDLDNLEKTLRQLCGQYDRSMDDKKKAVKQEIGEFTASVLHITRIWKETTSKPLSTSSEDNVLDKDTPGGPPMAEHQSHGMAAVPMMDGKIKPASQSEEKDVSDASAEVHSEPTKALVGKDNKSLLSTSEAQIPSEAAIAVSADESQASTGANGAAGSNQDTGGPPILASEEPAQMQGTKSGTKEQSKESVKESQKPNDGEAKERELQQRLNQVQEDLDQKVQEVNDANKDLNQRYNKAQSELHMKEQEVKQLREDNTDLRERLSTEMGAKVSANESAVENISIQNRPMNIAGDYMKFQSEEWFEALDLVQNQKPDVALEGQLALLCRIIQLSDEVVIEAYSKYQEAFACALLEPADFAVEHFKNDQQKPKSDKSTKETDGNLPAILTNAVGDFLRNQADKCDYKHLIQVVADRAQERFEDITKLLADTTFKEYISATVKLCWKMVIQRPPMKFDFSETRFGENIQELYWGSDDSKDASICLVYPLLKHGDRIMAKGKIYLYKKSKRDSKKRK